MNDYFEKTREERTAHTDLTTECEFGTGPRGGSVFDPRTGKKALQKLLGVLKPKGHAWHTCHLCENDTGKRTDKVCSNPKHLYFGTPSENQMDISPEVRKKSSSPGGKVGGFVGGKHPNNGSQLQVTCPHCGKSGQLMNMARWHFDNCKHQSFSRGSVTMPFFP